MPSKRKIAAAVGPVSASQPSPQPQRNTRASRKRTMSDADDLSDGESVISNASKASQARVTANKRKQVAVEIEREVIMEEDSVDEKLDDQVVPGCEQGEVMAMADTDEDDIRQAPAAKRQKMTVKRRTSSSAHQSKTVRTSRTSLLAGLQDGVENSQIVGEFTFSPLANVVERRMQERALHSPDGRFDGQEDPMSDRLVLDTHDEVVYPQLNISLEPVNHSATPRTSQRMSTVREDERRQFQDAIITYQRELAVATAKLENTQTEIRGLGFGNDELGNLNVPAEEATQIVLRSIREAMEAARSFLDEELPGAQPDDATNEDIVSILVANIREFVRRLRLADTETRNNAVLTTDLTRQIDQLLTTLADEKLKTGQLKKDNEISVERLTTSINKYIVEEKNLQAIVAQLEDSLKEACDLAGTRLVEVDSLHEKVHSLVEERDDLEGQLAKLDEDLRDEIEAKDQAEADLVAKDVELQDVQDRVDALEQDVDDQTARIEALIATKDTEQRQRIAAEAELDQANQLLEELEGKVHTSGVEANGLRAKIFELQNQIKKLEQEIADDVRLRNEASQLAEDREAQIAELEDEMAAASEKLQDVEADRDQQIDTLKDAINQKDVTISELKTSVDDFENSLHNSQEESNNYKITLRERDAAIAELEGQVQDLEAEKTSLEAEKISLEGRVNKEAMDMLEIQNDLYEKIDNLKANIADRNEKLRVVHLKREEEQNTMRELQEASDAEIAELRFQHAAELVARQDAFDALKRRFTEFIHQANKTAERQHQQRTAAFQEEEANHDAFKQASQQELDALAATTVDEVVAAESTTIAVKHKAMANGFKKPQRKSKRVVDSGVSLDDTSMMEDGMIGA